MLRLGIDLDGTIDAAPEFFTKLSEAVRSAGGLIYIVTAVPSILVTADDYIAKYQKLSDSGMPYDYLYIATDPVDKNKAAYCKSMGLDCLIDNKEANVEAVSAFTNAAWFIPCQPAH